MLPMTYKGFNRILLMYINTLWLDVYVKSEVYMLDIPMEHVRYTPAKSFEVWFQWNRRM